LVDIGEAEGREGFERVWQEAFAAGFIDGGLHGIDDFDSETLASGGDGTSQTGWARADNQDIALVARIHSVACTMTLFVSASYGID
jgi:hypothetical protein